MQTGNTYSTMNKQELGGIMVIYFTYTDEVMLREATGSDVVLQQLLGEVLVHLGCFMGIHCVPKGLV